MRLLVHILGLPERQLPRADAIKVTGDPRRRRSGFTSDLGQPPIRFRCV